MWKVTGNISIALSDQRGFRDDSPETVMREEARRRLRQQMAGNKSPYTTVTGAEKIRLRIIECVWNLMRNAEFSGLLPIW